MSHTPGPWIVPNEYPGEVERTDGKTIATCWAAPHTGATITVEGIADVSLEESAANARLIAAAPEMYEALKAAGVWMTSYPRLQKDDELWGVFSQVLAAISKATAN